MFRATTVPQMDDGRNGDMVIIDTSDDVDVDPTNIGMWIKIPLTDQRAPTGTVITGTPGTTNSTDTIVIDSITVSLTDPTSPQQIASDINDAAIANIYATALGGAVQIAYTSGAAITVGENTLGLSSIGALDTLVTAGVWMPMRIDSTGDYLTRTAQLYIEQPTEKTYPILQLAVFPFTVEKLVATTDNGSINVSVQINNVSISGMDSVAVTTVTSTTVHTSTDNVVGIGDSLNLVTTNNSSASDLSVTIIYEYRN